LARVCFSFDMDVLIAFSLLGPVEGRQHRASHSRSPFRAARKFRERFEVQ